MRAVGLVVEYNPFHNGHTFHLSNSKILSDSDVSIAVMSGNYLQRGEMAVVDKWSRTKMALASGVDIVVELPTINACQSAEIFAKSAVAILDKLKVDSLVFGSENGEIEPFINSVKLLEENSTKYNELVKQHIASGASYPVATGLALNEALETSGLDLSLPNNTLGLEYVSAILKSGSTITPMTFARVGDTYHESATNIRNSLRKKETAMVNFMPKSSVEEINSYESEFNTLHSWELYWPLLKYKIISSEPTQLQEVYGVSEGIENRLIKFAQEAKSFNDFISQVKSKRYTWTRLQRICLYILLDIKNPDVENQSEPSYIRVLGFSSKGQEYLSSIKKNIELPLVMNASSGSGEAFNNQLKFDQIYYQVLDNPSAHRRQFDGPIKY